MPKEESQNIQQVEVIEGHEGHAAWFEETALLIPDSGDGCSG
jgi:hypothetical protein